MTSDLLSKKGVINHEFQASSEVILQKNIFFTKINAFGYDKALYIEVYKYQSFTQTIFLLVYISRKSLDLDLASAAFI